MSANPIRGEAEIVLDGVTYVLRPSFAAMAAIERGSGKSLMQLAQASTDGLPLETLALIVTECVRAHGRETGDAGLAAWKTDRVAELIFRSGIFPALTACQEVLLAALSGGLPPPADAEKNVPAT